MLETLKINNILFLDIETVAVESSFVKLDEEFQHLWELKSRYFREKEELTIEESYNKAGIYAEFGKIVCVSVGYITSSSGEREYRTKSFYSHNEKELLEEFSELLTKHFDNFDSLLCAHNGKEFDFPYIARRMIIHRIELPSKLNLFGKKPWEVPHLDTLELWKFGDYKHYTSLKLLTSILGVPSPKDDIDGSEVANVYYKENDLLRIVNYCEKDTIAVAQLLLRFNNKPIIEERDIVRV